MTFTLTITGCELTLITSSPISAQRFTINDVVNTFSFLAWTESYGVCGPFTYTAQQTGGAALPALLTLDSFTQTFSVDTTVIFSSVTYSIQLVGTLPAAGPTS